MKIFSRRFLALFLALALSLGCCTSASAIEVGPDVYPAQETYVVYDDGETVVDMFESDDGSIVFRQYLNDVLIQRNTLNPDSPYVIVREFFNSSAAVCVASDTISVSDFGTLAIQTPVAQPAATTATLGTINYRALVGSSVIDYGLECSYTSRTIGSTTYTVNNFLGKLIDLASLLVGAFDFPAVVANAYLADLLPALGIAVVAGALSSVFTDTVSCNELNYIWTLQDTTLASHRDTVYGYRYYITDVHSDLQGSYYFDGYIPRDWGTQELAVWFHGEMFAYDSWQVLGYE